MNKTIMVVEDEQIFHDLYEVMLENTGYEIISVYDGYEALVKLEETRPDLIITDIVLSMMTGDTLFLYLKSIPKYEDIPIIMISNVPYGLIKAWRRLIQILYFLTRPLQEKN